MTNLSLPNIFSPDGSGLNDVFTPIISGPFDQFSIEIYNRWGKMIYGPATDPFFQWDGKENNGLDAPAGVYYWLVNASFKGEKYPPQRGFVTLMRGNN
jgi:gliding motility-associated-like protein